MLMVDSESLLRFWWSLQGGPSGEEIEGEGKFWSQVALHQRLSAEKPQQGSVPETVIAITRFHTGVSWHFRSLKDQVLKIELQSLSVFSMSAKLK